MIGEKWKESDRPAYCSSCNWSGAMKDVMFLEGDCFPFRCPSCGGIIANRKGEE
jgi:predicted RNA-binding Zn-ribbon protein involved in translation (DUF1610 family)